MFPRLLLLNRPGDADAISTIQDRITLETIPRSGKDKCTKYPPLTTDLINVTGLSPPSYVAPQQFNLANVSSLFNVVAKVASYNLPASNVDNKEVLQNLTIAGIRDGTYTPPASLNLTAVQSSVKASLAAAAADQDYVAYGSPGWRWTKYIGNFGYHYDLRAAVTVLGYLSITIDQNLPPLFVGLNKTGANYHQDDEALILSFHSKPPVDRFWSLTAYDAEGFLVPNPLDRYGLGDRSNLTYPDGKLVYGNDSSDGEFQVLFQNFETKPPTNWTNNWLPTPANGSSFNFYCEFKCHTLREYHILIILIVRMYGAQDAALNGEWEYPTFKVQPAVKA